MIKNRSPWIIVVALLIASLLGAAAWDFYQASPKDARASFVGGSSCIECHQQQFDLFHGSHHDRAMDIATPKTVLANFDGTRIDHFGITSTVYKSGEKFMVNTEGPDGTMQDFEVKMVFGCEPLQQYMVELDEPSSPAGFGQYQVLRLSWDTRKKEWFYLEPPDVHEKLEPDDPLHWTGISQRWNTNCASCHSTNLKKNFDSLSNKYCTTFTDIDVNCESCHGPGSLHVEIAKRRRFFWDRNHGYGLTKLKTTSNLPQIESCAPCHSRRSETCSGFQAGKRFDDFYACQLISDRVYHDDGQIRDEDYVYGSFIQSKMFHQGIRCTDCHDPHSTKLKFDGNKLCTSCHQHPAGKYDSPTHHRHANGSTGSQCVECHMPSTTYMAIDERRDHSLRVPRPDLSLKYGTPNACSACHLDSEKLPATERGQVKQYLDWIIAAESGNKQIAAELNNVNRQMAEAFAEWYPEAATNEKRSTYYERLATGKSDDENDVQELISLSVDRKAPAIFRASAIESLNSKNSSDLATATAMEVLTDPDPKVIAAALSVLDSEFANLTEKIQYKPSDAKQINNLRTLINLINPFLDHDSRLVRVATARTLSNIPLRLRHRCGASISQLAFQRAIGEFKESQRVNNDMAFSHLILAGLHESDGQFSKAELAYQTAIVVEPNFVGSRSNLAALLDNRAEQLRSQIIQSPRSPDNVELGKRIDKLTTDATRLRHDEHQLLEKEVARAGDLFDAHSLFYRFGLSCYLMGDQDNAEKYLSKACDSQPDSPTYLMGLATFYNQHRDFKNAIPYANKLIEIDRDHVGYKQLRDEILAGLAEPK